MVPHNDDVDAAMQVHLLQAVHQLTDDVVHLLQRVVQLQAQQTVRRIRGQRLCCHGWTCRRHLAAQRPQAVSEGVGLLRVDGVDVRPGGAGRRFTLDLHPGSFLSFKLKIHPRRAAGGQQVQVFLREDCEQLTMPSLTQNLNYSKTSAELQKGLQPDLLRFLRFSRPSPPVDLYRVKTRTRSELKQTGLLEATDLGKDRKILQQTFGTMALPKTGPQTKRSGQKDLSETRNLTGLH